jgi:hypothetical protein
MWTCRSPRRQVTDPLMGPKRDCSVDRGGDHHDDRSPASCRRRPRALTACPRWRALPREARRRSFLRAMMTSPMRSCVTAVKKGGSGTVRRRGTWSVSIIRTRDAQRHDGLSSDDPSVLAIYPMNSTTANYRAGESWMSWCSAAQRVFIRDGPTRSRIIAPPGLRDVRRRNWGFSDDQPSA